jgi:hypothetical protein
MKFFKKSIFLVLTFLCFSNCGSNHQKQMDFSQEIERAYYENEEVNDQGQVVILNFYIEFTESLSKEIHLEKVYFRNQQAEIKKVSDRKYRAQFSQQSMKEDLILDSDRTKEYGNKAPIITKPKFKLNKGEAVLEYQKNNEILFFKLTEIDEKQ